jgi:dimethylargininase
MTNSALILTRQPCTTMDAAELTHMARAPIDMNRARIQHAAYQAALAATGAEVISLAPLDDHPDCCFVEDTVLAFPACFVLTRPGAASRQGEVAPMALALPKDRPILHLAAPATLDGGDVMRVGKQIFVGRSNRTNAAGIAALADTVAPFGYKVTGVDMAGALHLKTAVTALAPDRLLVNPAWLKSDLFDTWHRIEVAPEEPFAANHVSVNGKTFMAAAHPQTAARLASAGFDVTVLEVDEFAKAEGGLTCMSVVVPPSVP